MRLFGSILLLLFHLSAAQATAGPWLKTKGSSFTSVSFSMTWFRDMAQTSYVEFGLRDDLTLGLDMGFDQSRFGLLSGYAVAFGRRAIGSGEGPHRFAYEIGIGAAWEGDATSPLLKTGLSWGRGFEVGERNGWATVDASVVWDLGLGLHLGKLDATVGLTINDVFTGMLQVYSGTVAGDTFATIAPSVVLSPWKGDSKFRIQIGAETDIGNQDNSAIKIGLWREF